MSFTLLMTSRASEQLKSLPADARDRIFSRIDRLAAHPFPRETAKLGGSLIARSFRNSFMLGRRGVRVEIALRSLCLALILVLMAPQIHALGNGSADSKRVRVLYIGEPMRSPLPWFAALINDPFFDLTPVQAFTYGLPLEVAWKSVRQYMPRTYAKLAEYDAVTLVYADARLFKPEWKSWFSEAVLQGTGLTFAGQDVEKFAFLWEWLESTVGDVLPVETPPTTPGGTVLGDQPGSIRVLRPDNPLMASLPWSEMGRYGTFYDCTRIDTKQGSETLAELVTAFGRAYPFLVWWRVGEGRSLAIMTRFSSDSRNPEDPFFEWPYQGDFACNCHLYMAGRRIPDDTEILHKIRTTWMDSYLVRNLLVGSIDFISKLGGNPAPLERMLREADDKLKDSRDMYLDYDFEGSLALAEELVGNLGGISEATIRVKDQVFRSIYLIEWSILMATSMLSGVVIWSLMVRRRLYKEAGITRPVMA